MDDAPKIPPQSQDAMPASEHPMEPAPDYMPRHPGTGKLKGRTAFISGGDSGIGRAVAVLFAREGANVAFAFLDEEQDAEETVRLIEAEGGEALPIKADLGWRDQSFDAIGKTVQKFGGLDVLVNNAAQQWIDKDFAELSEEKIRQMLGSNVMSYMFCTQAALPHLKEGAAIVNTTSVNAFKGNASLVTYTVTRGASLAFTRAMASNLVDRGIRVNAVAPGPIWTPFIPGTMPAEGVEDFGQQVPMQRPGQPWEVATSFLFLASDDGSYFTGQCLHPNGGMIVGA
jgi:NAD(P)-dependent dehydrogenase (short-subunit alcohol dehydrogenase family)